MRCVIPTEGEGVVPPPDHDAFVELRARGFAAIRRALAKRKRPTPTTMEDPCDA